jgi:hypothetical protein
MHKWLDAWVKKLLARDQSKGGEVTAITKENLTKEDLAEFNARWESVPCAAGEVRISMPHLAHGAIGPARTTRRTILPWFCMIHEDHIRLEIEAGGKWEDLARAHRDLVSGPSSPSGKPNVYGDIPYRFPACLPLQLPNEPLSDALVGRIKWNSPEVQRELRFYFSMSMTELQAELRKWQAKAETAVLDRWQLVMQYEKEAFGARSYVYNVMEGNGQRGADGQFVQPKEDFSRADGEAQAMYEAKGELAEADLPCDLEVPLPGIDNSDVHLGSTRR